MLNYVTHAVVHMVCVLMELAYVQMDGTENTVPLKVIIVYYSVKKSIHFV